MPPRSSRLPWQVPLSLMRDTNSEQPFGGCRRLVNRKFKRAFSLTGTVSTEQRVVNREPRKSGGQPRGWSPSFARPKEGDPRKGRPGSPPLRGVPVLLDKARHSVQLAHSTELRYELGGRSHRYARLTRSSPSARPSPSLRNHNTSIAVRSQTWIILGRGFSGCSRKRACG